MTHMFKTNPFLILVVAVFSILAFSNGCKNDCKDNCCKGYTGKITDSSAVTLTNTCHFIGKDSILVWTARYQANKSLICNDSLPGKSDVLGDSSSFNNCIVKKLICNPNSIGLRVIDGMDHLKKVHVILVGIKPDYSTLYIPMPTDCCSKPNTKVALPEGGAEYGQMP